MLSENYFFICLYSLKKLLKRAFHLYATVCNKGYVEVWCEIEDPKIERKYL